MKSIHFHSRDTFKNVVCEMAAILSQPQCGKSFLTNLDNHTSRYSTRASPERSLVQSIMPIVGVFVIFGRDLGHQNGVNFGVWCVIYVKIVTNTAVINLVYWLAMYVLKLVMKFRNKKKIPHNGHCSWLAHMRILKLMDFKKKSLYVI